MSTEESKPRCGICKEEFLNKKHSFECGHGYCIDCILEYLKFQLNEEIPILGIVCPQVGCGHKLCSMNVRQFLLKYESKNEYFHKLNHLSVMETEVNSRLRWNSKLKSKIIGT